MNEQNLNMYYNKHSVIIAYDINDKVLEDNFEFGEYNLKWLLSDYKDVLLKYFEIIYFLKFSPPNSLIIKEMIE